MVYFRENNFSISSLSHPKDVVVFIGELIFMLVPEEHSLVVDFDVEEYEKIFLANFSYEFPVVVRLSQQYQFYGSSEKEYVLKPGQNATFYFVKQKKTWFITM